MKQAVRFLYIFVTVATMLPAFVSAPVAATSPIGWPRHHVLGGRLQFSCPSNLVVTEDTNRVVIEHSIPFRHLDPCDRTHRHQIGRVVDFHVVISLDPRPALEVVKSQHPDATRPRVTQREIYGDDSLLVDAAQTLQPGYVPVIADDTEPDWIRRGRIGAFGGFRVRTGTRDCGSQTHYFYLAEGTLIVTRAVIAPLGDSPAAMRRFQNLAGVIPPAQEEEIFEGIIESIAVMEPAPARPVGGGLTNGSADHAPPAVPDVQLVGIWRGFGSYGDGEKFVRSSNSESGSIVLTTTGSDDQTPSESLRYRLRYVGGDLPFGWRQPRDWETSLTGGHTNLRWGDGRTWTQEPFSFRLAVTAIDLAGNESAPDTILIAHDGDMSRQKQELIESSPSRWLTSISEFRDPYVQRRSFDIIFRPDQSVLKAEEYPLPAGERPSAKFLRRFGNTFLRTAQGRRWAYRTEAAIVPLAQFQRSRHREFRLGDERYVLDLLARAETADGEDSVATFVVRHNDAVVFTTETRFSGPCHPAARFSGWTGGNTYHWMMEYEKRVIVDGEDIGQQDGLSETFCYRFVHQKAFYFGRRDDGVRAYWNGCAVPRAYDEIEYAPPCESQDFNPVAFERMVCFYARRGHKWYYVEVGLFGTADVAGSR